MKSQLVTLLLSSLATLSFAKKDHTRPEHVPEGDYIVPCVRVDCTKICNKNNKQYNDYVCLMECDNDESKPLCDRRGGATTTITYHETTTFTSYVHLPTQSTEEWIGTVVPTTVARAGAV